VLAREAVGEQGAVRVLGLQRGDLTAHLLRELLRARRVLRLDLRQRRAARAGRRLRRLRLRPLERRLHLSLLLGFDRQQLHRLLRLLAQHAHAEGAPIQLHLHLRQL